MSDREPIPIASRKCTPYTGVLHPEALELLLHAAFDEPQSPAYIDPATGELLDRSGRYRVDEERVASVTELRPYADNRSR